MIRSSAKQDNSLALTSAILVAHLPTLGCWDSKSLTCLVGLASGLRTVGRNAATKLSEETECALETAEWREELDEPAGRRSEVR